MIRVLVVEDSLVQRTLLVGLLKADPEISVVGAVTSGAEALAFLARDKPDVVTMDLRMPDMNGLEVTRQIMETTPLPVVIVSEYWDAESADLTFRAMEAGAVAGVSKPSIGLPDSEEVARQLIQTVKLMSEVKVIRRWPRSRRADNLTLLPKAPPSSSRLSPTSALLVTPPPPAQPKEISLVAIGASTGGPPVLRTILAALPRTFPVPILIVQHIAKGFTSSLVQWLKTEASPLVQLAKQGEEMLVSTLNSKATRKIAKIS